MQECWKHNPKQRPTFCEIVELLVPELDPSFKDVAYFFSEENQHERDAHITQEVEPVDFDEESVYNMQTPLTGSPQLSLHDLDVESDSVPHGSRHSLQSQSQYNGAKCDHQQDCNCVEINSGHKIKGRTLYPHRHSPHEHNNGTGQDPLNHNEVIPIGSSNEGSNESSKSSGSSSYYHLNGIANGRIPKSYMPKSTQC